VIQLRSCEPRDLVALHTLDHACFAQGIAYSKAELHYFLTNPRCSCWIAEQPERKLAGFVIVERAHLNGRPAGHIVTLDVDPAARRLGLGTLLMQTAEEQMKQEGAAWMSLEVAENNIAARHFYRNLGFITRGKIAKYYGGTIDAEVMQKAL
jgi:ribosomal protein S18 acetylase RimI-like enzyme